MIFIAAAPVVGHMYSVFLKGTGGKGVATGAGVVIALVPLAGGIIAWCGCFSSSRTRYVSLASLVATLLVPVFVFALGDPLPYQIAAVLVTVGIFWAHRGNIRRLFKGTENRVKLPWSRDHSALAGRRRVVSLESPSSGRGAGAAASRGCWPSAATACRS